MTPRWLLAFGLLAAGCTAPPTGTLSYLLLDRDAREAGLKLETSGWQGAPLLPIALRPEDQASLVMPGGRLPIALERGAFGWVRGGAVDWRAVGVELAADRLLVDGKEAAVRTLADLLGAEVSARDDGRFLLHGPELFERASFLPVPDGLVEIAPELLTAPAAATTTNAAETVAASDVRTPALTELVGVYATSGGGGRALVLDTDGGFTLGACNADELRGRYRRVDSRVELTPSSGEAFELHLGPNGELTDAAGEPFLAVGESK